LTEIKQVTIADGVFIYNGDCREVMAQLEPASVDAIVCDPPYGLEFMGKGWDHGVPGAEFWAEALRVLKPGGHLLAFGGTRTFHRLAVAIEDAGFEIRDTLSWMYGCLTDDADVLTEHGWKRGIDVAVGEKVAQWDPDTEAITFAPVERKYLAPWDGPMRVFRNADMDQVVTPNHRVWHRTQPRRRPYPEEWGVAEASEVTAYLPTQFPLSGRHDGPGIGGEDYASLLGWVWTEGGFDNTGSGVRLYQSMVNPVKVKEIDSLIERMGVPAKRYERERAYAYVDGERAYTEVCWFFTGDWAERVRADLPGKQPTWGLLWAMNQDEKQAFYDAAMAGDGSGMAFYQDSVEDREWFITLLATIGKRGRDNPRKRCVSIASRGMTEMQSRHFKAAPDEHYTGMVWCVGVPTGAFVARRNGKVFITGNSGFPKSMDVSKAIEKASPKGEASDREVPNLGDPIGNTGLCVGDVDPHTGRRIAGIKPGHETFIDRTDEHSAGGREEGWERPWRSDEAAVLSSHLAFVNESDEAEQWAGWGTALKPAYEPIILARKPLTKPSERTGKPVKATVAETVLEHGTGALNIDATRIGFKDEADRAESTGKNQHADYGSESGAKNVYGDYSTTAVKNYNPPGRWPANVMLTHHEDCTVVGTRHHSECSDDCPVRLLDEQSGVTKSTGGRTKNITPSNVYGAGKGLGTTGAATTTADEVRGDPGFGDVGGASRFFYSSKTSKRERNAGLPEGKKNDHPTVKPVAVMSWLVKLVTPPGGVVLDPFMGSGSTGVAAVTEGFRFTGIDLEPAYCNIAWHRMKHAVASKEG